MEPIDDVQAAERSSGVKDLISSFERRGSGEFKKLRPCREPEDCNEERLAAPLWVAPTPLRNRGSTTKVAEASTRAAAAPTAAAVARKAAAPKSTAAAATATAAVARHQDDDLVDRALKEAEQLMSQQCPAPEKADDVARPARLSEASTAETWDSMQAKIRAEVDKQFDAVVQRMAQEQEEALQKVKVLQERSQELEREVERSRRESRPQRLSVTFAPEPTVAAEEEDEHDRIRSLIMTPRKGANNEPSQAKARSSAAAADVGGPSRGSVAPKALRRHSTSCMALGACDEILRGDAPASARSSRTSSGRKSTSDSVSELKLMRRWMMEQRSNLVEELYPYGSPTYPAPQKATRSRLSAPGFGSRRPEHEIILEH